jgi:hypothetical protein
MFQPDELLLALSSADVEFVVIGGVAVGVQGYVRATKDLDIVPEPGVENLTRLAARSAASRRSRSEWASSMLRNSPPTRPIRSTSLREQIFVSKLALDHWTSCSGWPGSKGIRCIRIWPSRRSRFGSVSSES